MTEVIAIEEGERGYLTAKRKRVKRGGEIKIIDKTNSL